MASHHIAPHCEYDKQENALSGLFSIFLVLLIPLSLSSPLLNTGRAVGCVCGHPERRAGRRVPSLLWLRFKMQIWRLELIQPSHHSCGAYLTSLFLLLGVISE